jgi:hypothetical protein
LYSQVPTFGDVSRQLRMAQRGLASVEQRIAALNAAAEAAARTPPVPLEASSNDR